MSTSRPSPRRGEIWLINLDPTVGSEIQKIRPAVIVSSDAFGRLPLRLVAPITGWQDHFKGNIWHLRIDPDSRNGLSKTSTIDALQLRGVDTSRFIKKLGHLPSSVMEELAAAIAAVVEYQ
ncbi:MAG: type II toxin-antitoxin system PemK/MazF family toxin [Nitrospira sp.]|nr:type II toxin-antitoxin system PemK/MazF family toxin [Nitrospira sp.]